METTYNNNSGTFGSIFLFIILLINLFYQKNLVAGISFLIGSFLVFDTYRRIHKSYFNK